VLWNKPLAEQCPKCGSPYLLEKTTKREGTVHYCNEETCDYKIPVETTDAEVAS
jgi:DNA topoisomerase-1